MICFCSIYFSPSKPSDYILTVLGAFAKLRKATISFFMSVCPTAWNKSASTGRIFMKVGIWVFFENLSRKFKFHWNMTRITGTLDEDKHIFFYIISLSFFLQWEVVQSCRDNKGTFYNQWLFFENHAFHEIKWKHFVAQHATDDSMAHAYCMLHT
jgi:hypothetical protein